jgi:formylglycine-generating enzyme required for sulfatase activity
MSTTTQTWAKVGRQLTVALPDGVELVLLEIPAGEFLMGSPDNEPGRYADEGPQHKVVIDKPFYLGETEVTQRQWRSIAALPKVKIDLKPDPSHFKGDDLPVESINWHESQEAAARVAAYTGLDFGLPSEAKWEYACRAGTTTRYYTGDTITSNDANFDDSANGGVYRAKTTPVKTFKPNPWGLYDMHGNLWEWCDDDWHPNYNGAPTDGSSWRD